MSYCLKKKERKKWQWRKLIHYLPYIRRIVENLFQESHSGLDLLQQDKRILHFTNSFWIIHDDTHSPPANHSHPTMQCVGNFQQTCSNAWQVWSPIEVFYMLHSKAWANSFQRLSICCFLILFICFRVGLPV